MEWRNDADAVRFSVSGRAVTAEEHEAWFASIGEKAGTLLWIAEEEGSPVGQVRVDVDDGVGIVSIAVGAEHRGRRVGSEILRAMLAEMNAGATVRLLKALTHPDNAASLRMFERAGFHLTPVRERGFLVLECSV
jgi:RimJ/RimL family protein N-acetyltransferase